MLLLALISMSLDDMTRVHHAPLLATLWRELNTLDVRRPRMVSIYGVEDFDHPRNRVGMVEVECVAHGKPVVLSESRMIPLARGYRPAGEEQLVLAQGYSAKGLSKPDLSLIRLPPPTLDLRLARLVLSHGSVTQLVPDAVGSVALTLTLAYLTFTGVLTGFAQQVSRWSLATILVSHAVEGLFALYVSAFELGLPLAAASKWAALAAAVGFPCTRWLLQLRAPRLKAE